MTTLAEKVAAIYTVRQRTPMEKLFELSAAFSDVEYSLKDFFSETVGHLKGIDCVLVGGMALSNYAKPRNTEDADFMIAGASSAEVKERLLAADFLLLKEFWYEKPKCEIHKYTKHGREADFIFFGDADFTNDVLRRAKKQSGIGALNSDPVKVISLEDIVIMKLVSFRYKDKADIMAMRAKLDALDLGYIRGHLWNLGISDRIEFLKLPVEE